MKGELLDSLKELNAYLKSAENLKDCEPFEQLNQKYVLLQKQYCNSFNELYKEIESRAYRCEYSKGGAGFIHGFYSPSLMDLVVGGMNRGRILKRPRKNGDYDYKYVFDEQDNLICIFDYCTEGSRDNPTIELFIYEQGKVLSLIFIFFDDNHELRFLSECQYENGRLMRYENAICGLFDDGKGCTEINVETHEYADDSLKSVSCYNYMPSEKLLLQDQYIFNRDAEGYLSTYTYKKLGGFKPKTNFDNDSTIYKVGGVKRK